MVWLQARQFHYQSGMYIRKLEALLWSLVSSPQVNFQPFSLWHLQKRLKSRWIAFRSLKPSALSFKVHSLFSDSKKHRSLRNRMDAQNVWPGDMEASEACFTETCYPIHPIYLIFLVTMQRYAEVFFSEHGVSKCQSQLWEGDWAVMRLGDCFWVRAYGYQVLV